MNFVRSARPLTKLSVLCFHSLMFEIKFVSVAGSTIRGHFCHRADVLATTQNDAYEPNVATHNKQKEVMVRKRKG